MVGTGWFQIVPARLTSNHPGSSFHVSTAYRFSPDTFSVLTWLRHCMGPSMVGSKVRQYPLPSVSLIYYKLV
jgi:hypothetical protein